MLQATRQLLEVTAVTPTDHAPQGRVSVESMTLKEAYSVPKHTSAICVQSFDDSLNSAIHITYRISLRSSSLREPRYPLSRVLGCFKDTHSEELHHRDKLTQKSWLIEYHTRVTRCGTSENMLTKREAMATRGTPNITFRKGWYGFTIMILPQVHLRKPCYDFYFL